MTSVEAELVRGGFTVLAVLVGGMMAWRAGLILRLEEDIRKAYAEFGGAYEDAFYAIEAYLKFTKRLGMKSGEEIGEVVERHNLTGRTLRVALHRLRMMDRDPGRTAFMVRSVDGLFSTTEFEKDITVALVESRLEKLHDCRLAYYDWQDKLPRHFTSLGQVVAD